MDYLIAFAFFFIGGQFAAIMPTFLIRLSWDKYMVGDLFWLDTLAEKMGIEWESTMHEVIRIGVLNQIVLLALAWPFING